MGQVSPTHNPAAPPCEGELLERWGAAVGEAPRAVGYLWEGLVEREPAAERHDPGQLVLTGESSVQRQGTTLQQGKMWNQGHGGCRDIPRPSSHPSLWQLVEELGC